MWATKEQDDFLREHVSEYKERQGAGSNALADFWPKLYSLWFAKFPSTEDIPADGTPIVREKGQPAQRTVSNARDTVQLLDTHLILRSD